MLRYCAEDQRGGWCCHGGGARDAGRAAKGRPWAVRHRRRVSACLLEGAVSNGTNSSVRGRSRTRTLELRIAGHREEGSSRRGQIALPRFDLWTVALFCFLPYTLWTLTFSRSVAHEIYSWCARDLYVISPCEIHPETPPFSKRVRQILDNSLNNQSFRLRSAKTRAGRVTKLVALLSCTLNDTNLRGENYGSSSRHPYNARFRARAPLPHDASHRAGAYACGNATSCRMSERGGVARG
jgi:hypothetical protein